MDANACLHCRAPITSPHVPDDKEAEPGALLCGPCVSRALARMATMLWHDPVGNNRNACPEERLARIADYERRAGAAERRARSAREGARFRAIAHILTTGTTEAKARAYGAAVARSAEARSWERERPLTTCGKDNA